MEPSFLGLLQTIPWYAWIAVVAIVSGAVTRVVAMSHAHRERIEMIRMGMNPDARAGEGKPRAVEEV